MNKQDKCKISKNCKDNLHFAYKLKLKIDIFISGLDMEANRAASAETTLKIHTEYSNVLPGIGCFKTYFFTGQA